MKIIYKLMSGIMLLMVMFISSLFIFQVNASSEGQVASTITLAMSDGFGDGWNGNGIEVYIDGVSSGLYTFSSGYSATHDIPYDSNKTYEFKWVQGKYASECSFTIKLGEEQIYLGTQTQCKGFSNNYIFFKLESVNKEEPEIHYDLEGEFAGGSGTTADPYLVATKSQLNNVRFHSDSNFRQVKDIVFTPSDFEELGDFYNDGNGWKPIGNYPSSFSGSYDGNGYTIHGLTITTDSSKYEYVGLFGYTSYGNIVNVKLNNIFYNVSGIAYVGGIVGSDFYGEIIGCSANGKIYGENGSFGGVVGSGYNVKYCDSSVSINIDTTNLNATAGIGGIVGYAVGKIMHCVNNGNIVASGYDINIGGIASSTFGETISCKNNGNITMNSVSAQSNIVEIGGIVGHTSGNISKCENNGVLSGNGSNIIIGGIFGDSNSSNEKISQCVNRGNISTINPAKFSYVGGIAGRCNGVTISDCYVPNTVTLISKGTSTSVAGGIAGALWDDCIVKNCYSLVNNISINYSASARGEGGIAGHNYGSITKCYYIFSYGVGYNDGPSSASRISSLSSFESISTYSDYNFTSIWQMGTSTYKYAVLRMESGHKHNLSYNAATVTYESAGNLENWYCSTCDTYFRNSSCTWFSTKKILKSDPLPIEGSCGDGVNWKLTNEGEMVIYGSGKMDDYTNTNPAPWNEHREKIKSITVKHGVTAIGNNAFIGCTNLTNINFEAGIEIIGDSAFSGCNKITKLIIPKEIAFVGKEAFSSINNLIVCFEGEAPEFSGSNVFLNTSATVYYLDNDITWTTNLMNQQTGSINWSSYMSIEEIIIDSGLSDYNDYINWKISINGILTITGKYNSLELPNYTYSSQEAWDSYKDDIIAVKLVNISRIGNYTFSNYKSLKSVDFGIVEEVGSYAFECCTALESVFLSNYWGYGNIIEEDAFTGCSSLKQVSFPRETTIQDYAFSGCSKLDEVYITTFSEAGGVPITASSNSFYGITATVYVPAKWSYPRDYGDFGGDLSWSQASYGTCGSDAYWSYNEKTCTITISGSDALASYSSGSKYPWYGLRNEVTKVVIEEGITFIPSYVFEYMNMIQTVKLPNTLQELACNAFNNCKSLNNLIIPASLKMFSKNCNFNRCDALTDIYYVGTAREWENIENNTVVGVEYDNISNIHFLVLIEKLDPTCTLDGHEAYYQFDEISIYSKLYNLDKQIIDQPEVIESLGHNYVTTAISPTCIEQGYTVHKCHCGDEYRDSYSDALGHDMVLDEKVDPTCVDTGLTEGSHCLRCDHKVEQVIIEALGHSYEIEKTEPTCTDKGYTTYICYCGYEYIDLYVDALEHDLVIEEGLDPTCTESGLTEGSHCLRCEYIVEQVLIEALGHRYVNVITEPTCEVEGYTTHTCYCGKKYIDSFVAKLGHDILIDERVEPTCIKSGLTEGSHCSRCEYIVEQVVIEALGHDTIIDKAVEPTCIKSGLTEGSHCSRCDYIVEQEIIDALGHSYESVVTEPTCKSDGYTTYTCHCGEEYIDAYVVALGHNMIIDERVEPTCTETGLTEGSHCLRCEYIVEQVVIEALGHRYVNVITEPTCEAEGYTTHICHCGEKYIDSFVDKLGHDIIIDKKVEPTCEEVGLTEGSHCSRCDYKVAQEEIQSLGHLYGEWIEIQESTCSEHGLKERVCETCSNKETEKLQLKEHIESKWIIDQEATVNKEGHKHTECTVCQEVIKEEVIDKISETTPMSGCPMGFVSIMPLIGAFALVLIKKRK